jgi:hypothetical protein
MPTVHTKYVTWISRGRRHHGSSQMDLVSPLTTLVPNGGSYQAWASPEINWEDAAHDQHDEHFAFWSITGAADGASISTNQSLTVAVGGGDVYATAWYIEGGIGGPGGGPGVMIDAFDVGLGNFVDDDFVDVVTDASLTFQANEDGWVPTAGAAEDVRAYTGIHGVPFDDWQVFVGAESVTNVDLDAAQNSSAVAFAFYKTPARVPIGHGHDRELGTWVSWGVKVDGGGPTGNGPVPPWNPLIERLAAGFALAEAGQETQGSIRSATLRLAARQVTQAAAAISKEMNAAAGAAREVERIG